MGRRVEEIEKRGSMGELRGSVGELRECERTDVKTKNIY